MIEKKNDHDMNIIEFPVDYTGNFSDLKAFSNDKSLLKYVAIECVKKSDFKGSPSKIVEQYINIYNTLKSKILNEENKTNNITLPEQTVFDDYIVCLEDGKKMQMLNRHLKVYYNMTFHEYKKKWNLPLDYPSTCKNYSKKRADIAKRRKAS